MSTPDRKSVSLGRVNSAILAGIEDLTLWSDEELLRGQRRDKNGKWRGRRPKVVPKAIHDELVARSLSKARALLNENAVEATTVLISIAKDPDADDAVRLKAVGMILDRVLGRAPEHVKVEVQPAWAEALQAALIAAPPVAGVVSLDDGEDEPLEAESWEVDDDDI